MKTETYAEKSGIGKTGQALKQFGEQQNALNAQLAAQVEMLEKQLEEAMQCIAQLKAEQEKNITRFGRCAAELDEVQKELDRLRLTTKLNTNAIDRMAKGTKTE
ncbi:MAG: hypothetical protein E7504_00275 [Ruminococcus sp.]|nr:hypothetical protein [Ruminococcus sp.]